MIEDKAIRCDECGQIVGMLTKNAQGSREETVTGNCPLRVISGHCRRTSERPLTSKSGHHRKPSACSLSAKSSSASARLALAAASAVSYRRPTRQV